ncbi:ricin-type beta-trefoil lectin domain protein [Streptomyces sp. S.PNR 29]|uniref:ricin-type beta-trefoil lectin domain protein n=1 Tax=Streptomyces sp. S.PNR 29 TaxID=2973805 RepID=UPI0025B002FA|nr:ricin-type beta-trefoil lectin domain protein [Streptomyces sp. S.PNR 29]MDN0197751.1 ricin-type beta-trefoil lectin domain protein [Streptomyces sp. S.PNR 29]
MNDAGLPNSPASARRFDTTDEQLSAELRKWTGATPALQPVGELLDRHWEAAFAYARLCTDGPRSAGMLTTAAFTRLFGETLRQTGPTSAWRPQLLVTVRRIAAEWDTDRRREHLHPELCSEAGDGERVAARLLPTPDRRLLSGAFQRLPQSARCLLWHTEVEAEPLDVPGALLGLDEEGARVELGRARERLREECLQLHRELAPEQECRQYLRLLDVTYRRGGIDLDPDLRAHLDRCKHCRHTAEQLDRFNDGLGLALAEAVLGWGARAYVESRAAGADDPAAADEAVPPHIAAAAAGMPFHDAQAAGMPFDDAPEAAAPSQGAAAHSAVPLPPLAGEAFPTVAPRPRTVSRSAQKAARRARRRNTAVAVLTVGGLIVLPLVLWSTSGSGAGTPPADGAPSSDTPEKGTSTSDPSWADSGDAAKGALTGRLHNADSGLCVGLVGKKAVEGAETELATCSSEAGQQWTYETDGLLRSVADPGLCLDSHLGYSVRLAPCTGESEQDTKDIRYDFTLQGALVPRWDQDLALAPAATDGAGALVLKARSDSAAQRWVIDTSKTDLQMEVVNWDAKSGLTKSVSPTPRPTPRPSKTSTATPTPSPTPSTPTPTGPSPSSDPCSSYGYHCSWDGRYGRPGYGDGYGSGHGYGGGR